MALPNIISEINTIKSNYYTTSGGVFNNGASIGLGNDNSWKSIDLYSPESGACLNLRGGNSPNQPYSFVLATSSSDSIPRKLLYGDNTGALLWDGTNVVTDGCTLTNPFKTTHPYLCSRNTDDDRLVIFGGTNTNDGSYIRLSGKNENNPRTEIRVVGADSAKSLSMYPNGDFNWNNNPVVVLTKSYTSGSTGYRRYSDGYTEQWGYKTSIGNNASVSITLPIAMTTTGYNISTSVVRGSSYVNHISASGRTTTAFTLFNYRSYSSSTYSVGCLWYVCGY